MTSNSRTLSEYANYRSPWFKKTVILTTISFQYFWFLWSSTEDFTEGLAVKNDAELWMALTLIGFANGNLSYRVPCWTGTFVPPPEKLLDCSRIEMHSMSTWWVPLASNWRVECPFSTLSNFYSSFSLLFPFLRKKLLFWARWPVIHVMLLNRS